MALPLPNTHLCKHKCNNHYSSSAIKLNQATGKTRPRPLSLLLCTKTNGSRKGYTGTRHSKFASSLTETGTGVRHPQTCHQFNSFMHDACMHQFNSIGSQLTQLFWSNVIYVYNCANFENASGPGSNQTPDLQINRRQNMTEPSPNKLVATM